MFNIKKYLEKIPPIIRQGTFNLEYKGVPMYKIKSSTKKDVEWYGYKMQLKTEIENKKEFTKILKYAVNNTYKDTTWKPPFPNTGSEGEYKKLELDEWTVDLIYELFVDDKLSYEDFNGKQIIIYDTGQRGGGVKSKDVRLESKLRKLIQTEIRKIMNEEDKDKTEYAPLRSVKVTYADGTVITTDMAAKLTDDDIRKYFAIGKEFNIGPKGRREDNVQKVKKIEILK